MDTTELGGTETGTAMANTIKYMDVLSFREKQKQKEREKKEHCPAKLKTKSITTVQVSNMITQLYIRRRNGVVCLGIDRRVVSRSVVNISPRNCTLHSWLVLPPICRQ